MIYRNFLRQKITLLKMARIKDTALERKKTKILRKFPYDQVWEVRKILNMFPHQVPSYQKILEMLQVPAVHTIVSPAPTTGTWGSPPPIVFSPVPVIQTVPTNQGIQFDPKRLNAGRSNKTNQYYTTKEVKSIASKLGLSSSGTKKVLVQRVKRYLSTPTITPQTLPQQTTYTPTIPVPTVMSPQTTYVPTIPVTKNKFVYALVSMYKPMEDEQAKDFDDSNKAPSLFEKFSDAMSALEIGMIWDIMGEYNITWGWYDENEVNLIPEQKAEVFATVAVKKFVAKVERNLNPKWRHGIIDNLGPWDLKIFGQRVSNLGHTVYSIFKVEIK